jgi:4-diphosphocytidyl-2-C-methyl-D-erythritol kinase
MVVFPNAKINLGLRITSKRPDGYHDLDTVFYPIAFNDVLEIVVQPSTNNSNLSFSSSGLLIPGDHSANLCVKAYGLLKKKFPELPTVQMHLHKNIPMGAGLGGGSSDGAFTIRLLNDKFKLGLSETELLEMALELGSDCPFFIKNTPVKAAGRGEIMESISVDLSNKKILLVLPGIHVSTANAFKNCPIHNDVASCASILEKPIADWKDHLVNDFESTVFPLFPALSEIKQQLYEMGAVYASMSGTGSTIYGIFEGIPDFEGKFDKQYQVVLL